MSCKNKSCNTRGSLTRDSLTRDDTTGNLVCTSCGVVQEFDNFEAQIGGISGPQGTFIRVGSSGTGSFYNYKEKKILEANKLIEDFTFKLNLSPLITGDIKTLIKNITDGEFGLGDWFPVLIGACIYIVMRRDHKPLSIAEIVAVIGCCDDNELGRMIARVVEYKKDLDLPEFDIVVFFERTLKNLPCLVKLEREKFERIRKQGIFLMNCAVKWFLTTGRRPGPVVAGVLVFVAEVNGIVGCRIEDVAKKVNAAVGTCKLRYKEILERIVEVAQALPWGKDVNVKNVVKNAPLVIHYMEMKSMEEKGSEGRGRKKEVENVGIDLGEAVMDCLRKDVDYGEEVESVESDARYFEVEDRGGFERLEVDGVDKLKISHESLAMIYTKFADEVDCNKYLGGEREVFRGRKRRRAFELHKSTDWWNGKSELSKKLLLKKILEKDVGLDAMPPSFVKGCVANQRRREKIKAAKRRIDKIMHPSNTGLGDSGDKCFPEFVDTGKKRRRRKVAIDWEDFIIETLLLHQVKEEEIEKGHYNALLDLHVFNSGVM